MDKKGDSQHLQKGEAVALGYRRFSDRTYCYGLDKPLRLAYLSVPNEV